MIIENFKILKILHMMWQSLEGTYMFWPEGWQGDDILTQFPWLILAPRTSPYTVSLAGTMSPHHLLPSIQNVPSYTHIQFPCVQLNNSPSGDVNHSKKPSMSASSSALSFLTTQNVPRTFHISLHHMIVIFCSHSIPPTTHFTSMQLDILQTQ